MILNSAGACSPEGINNNEEQNNSCDSLGGSFTSNGISVPSNGPSTSQISTHINSVQGGDESISCNVNISLSQKNNDIVRNREILEDGKDVKTYQRNKRLKKADLSDLPITDVESFNEGANSSVGYVRQIIESSSLVEPVKFESDPCCLSSSMREKRETFNDRISAEVVQDKSLNCSSEFQEVSLNKYDGEQIGKADDTFDADMLVSDHLEVHHNDATEINGVADGAALSGVINVRVDRAFASCKQKKLLVLDLNGLLVDISSYVPYNYNPDGMVQMKAVFRRPHCDDFLNFCFAKFNVGVWTSRIKKNLDSLLKFLLGNSQSRLLFRWDQSHCTNTGFHTVEKRDKPLLLKKLKRLWDKHEPDLPWERGVYNESNTLLIDDSPCKALLNPRYTAIFPYTYRFTHVRDNSLGPGGDLRVYLEGLVEAENVQEYVKQNQFGQRAITEKNLSWGYYRKIIEANTTPPRQTDADNP